MASPATPLHEQDLHREDHGPGSADILPDRAEDPRGNGMPEARVVHAGKMPTLSE